MGMRRSVWAWALAAVVVAMGAGRSPAGGARPADDDPTYRTATGLLNRGMHELAAEEYRRFLKARPGDARAAMARYGLAVCLSRMGRSADAGQELDAVLEDRGFEYRADALLLRGRCHLEAGEYEPAAERMAQLAEEFPRFERGAAAASLEGEALHRARRFDEAARALERALRLNPEAEIATRAGYLLAMTEAELGKAREAAERLAALSKSGLDEAWLARVALAEAEARQRLGEWARATELYRAAAAEESLRGPALLGLGRALRRSGDTEGAAEALARAVEDGGESAGPAKIELARCWLDAGNGGRALEVMRSNAGWDGVRADEVAYWAARAEAASGLFEEAAARLGRALEASGETALRPNMLYDRGAALSRAGDTEGAIAAFEALEERYPGHELARDARLARASLLHSAGRFDASAGVCRAIAEDGDEAGARIASARLLLAENLYLARRDAEAERAYAAFLEVYPEDPRAWRAGVRRGLALARAGRGDEARPVLEGTLSDDRNEGDAELRAAARAALGDVAFAGEVWDAAESWYLRAVGPDDAAWAGVLLKLGLSVHRQGRAAEALAIYERVMKAADDEGVKLHAAFERGQALVELARLDEARSALEGVIAAERGGKERKFTGYAVRRLAAIASRQGRPGEAAELLAGLAGEAAGEDVGVELGAALLAAGKAAEAEASLREFLKAREDGPAVLRARAQLAIAVSRQSRYEEALGLIESAQRGGVAEELRPALRYEAAWALKALGRVEEAAEAYEELLSSAPPPSLEAHGSLDLAQLLVAGGRCEEAIELLERAEAAAARLDDGERAELGASAAYLRGVCAYRLSRWLEAAELLSAFIEAHGGHELAGSAALLAGESLVKAGRAGEAIAVLERAAGEADAKVRGPALLRLGEACAADGRWRRSEEALLAYLKEFGGEELWFRARFGVGWAREQQGELEGAMEAYREVAARHEGPTAARAQFQVGECLFAQRRHDEAVKELLKVDILFAYPEWSAAAVYEAGRCLEESGKTEEAKQQFRAVVERFGESEWAGPAEERLRAMRPAALPGRDEHRRVTNGRAAR